MNVEVCECLGCTGMVPYQGKFSLDAAMNHQRDYCMVDIRDAQKTHTLIMK